ncbi:MAG: gliding motility-associated C-terminal domain-containing protein [Muribaculaceae bacterium]|nr:gliding motility-associated C-terminal domain-containing protein [Muribaculaceae bacterium]
MIQENNKKDMSKIMSRALVLSGVILGCFFTSDSYGASLLSFEGNTYKVIDIDAEKSTGLNKIYVLNDLKGVSAIYTASENSNSVRWYRYSNLGGGYAEEITNVEHDGNIYRLATLEGDMGYIIEDGETSYYFWIVDYNNHVFHISNVVSAAQQDCDSETLDVTGSGEAIHYYTINGQPRVLSREIEVTYYTLKWDTSTSAYIQYENVVKLESMGSQIIVRPAALCDTEFSVVGDRFLKAWNMSESAETTNIHPHAVEVYTEVEQSDNAETSDSNVIKTDSNGMGGSAPAEISFYAYTTDGVMHEEWQMSSDPEFSEISHRFADKDLNYVFTEEGDYYLRFIGSNADGSCDAVSETYTVTIGDSELLCPNAFSPNDDGVNDIWKISYRSLLEFKCWIFDRTGKQLYHYTDPSGGWDGTYRGKKVKPGVYYYVIQATGSDGKKYKKSGDINIIRYRGGTGSSTEPTE